MSLYLPIASICAANFSAVACLSFACRTSASSFARAPLIIRDGHAIVPTRPGNGLVWDDAAVKHYRMR